MVIRPNSTKVFQLDQYHAPIPPSTTPSRPNQSNQITHNCLEKFTSNCLKTTKLEVFFIIDYDVVSNKKLYGSKLFQFSFLCSFVCSLLFVYFCVFVFKFLWLIYHKLLILKRLIICFRCDVDVNVFSKVTY